jgi:hypothetical protein
VGIDFAVEYSHGSKKINRLIPSRSGGEKAEGRREEPDRAKM